MENKLPADINAALDGLFTDDYCEPDTSNIESIEMNSYEDIAHYKDGTSAVLYHYCD